jgi:hypothetical protein
MIQQRYDKRDGSKRFLNWSYWEDGEPKSAMGGKRHCAALVQEPPSEA